ncbi:MAG TPA: hypothetical protein VGI97_00490 [Gemmatimonadaceae bacterium]|jgi:hypothetical protein
MIRSLPRSLEAIAWDAQSNAPDTCPSCGEQFEGTTQCGNCGWGEPDPEPDDHDMACDRDRDDAFDKECER